MHARIVVAALEVALGAVGGSPIVGFRPFAELAAIGDLPLVVAAQAAALLVGDAAEARQRDRRMSHDVGVVPLVGTAPAHSQHRRLVVRELVGHLRDLAGVEMGLFGSPVERVGRCVLLELAENGDVLVVFKLELRMGRGGVVLNPVIPHFERVGRAGAFFGRVFGLRVALEQAG